MIKAISSSELRTRIKRVLSEVEYGQAQYIVEKFGEPTAAIVSMEDFRLLQATRQQQANTSLEQIVRDIRSRNEELEPDQLDTLIHEARSAFYQLQGKRAGPPVRDIVNVDKVKAQLSTLLQRVLNGEEIAIAQAGKPVACLTPYAPLPARRMPGNDAGQVVISPDFDEPLPEFEAL